MEDRREGDDAFKEAVISELKTIKEEIATTRQLAEENRTTLREYTIVLRTVRYVAVVLFLGVTTQWDKLVKFVGVG